MRWISVKDKRRPKFKNDEEMISETILLWVPSFEQPVAMGKYLRHSKKFRPDGSMGFEDDVTHWRKLPKGPISEKSAG